MLIALSVLVSGCGKSFQPIGSGEEVNFSGGIKVSEFLTKAVYGGYSNRFEKNSKIYEPIYWSEGDLIKIYCSDGAVSEIEQSGVITTPAKYQADYVVSEVNATNSSNAKIKLNASTTPIGIRWNSNATKTHTFYAVYPAYQSGGNQITRSDNNGIQGSSIFCNLAEKQNTLNGALTSSDGNYFLAPDMKWMLMHGHASYTRNTFPSDGEVFIEFQPLTTAIQFEITNSTSASIVIKKLELISDTQISGTFDIADVETLGVDDFPVAANNTSIVGKSVCQDFSSSPLTLLSNKSFTFTFFLSPVADVTDSNKLRFRITRGDNSTMTTRLGYTDGTYVTFPRCKKSFVSGIMVPEGVQWTIDYEPVLTEWVDDGGESIMLN